MRLSGHRHRGSSDMLIRILPESSSLQTLALESDRSRPPMLSSAARGAAFFRFGTHGWIRLDYDRRVLTICRLYHLVGTSLIRTDRKCPFRRGLHSPLR